VTGGYANSRDKSASVGPEAKYQMDGITEAARREEMSYAIIVLVIPVQRAYTHTCARTCVLKNTNLSVK